MLDGKMSPEQREILISAFDETLRALYLVDRNDMIPFVRSSPKKLLRLALQAFRTQRK
jgi:hypothetical protein